MTIKIAHGDHCKNCTKVTRFARFRQNTQQNKQILNLANASMKDIIIYYEITTENINLAVSVYDKKLYFCKNA